jgi:hypothetical protein
VSGGEVGGERERVRFCREGEGLIVKNSANCKALIT